MRSPIRAVLPLRFGLAGGQLIADLHIVKPGSPRHSVLICQNMSKGPQMPGIATPAQQRSEGEAATIGKAWQLNADAARLQKLRSDLCRVKIGWQIYRRSGIMRRGTVFYVGAAKPAVCYDDAHLDPDCLYAFGEK